MMRIKTEVTWPKPDVGYRKNSVCNREGEAGNTVSIGFSHS